MTKTLELTENEVRALLVLLELMQHNEKYLGSIYKKMLKVI